MADTTSTDTIGVAGPGTGNDTVPGTLVTTTTQTLQTTQSVLQQVGTQLQNQTSNQQYNLGNFVTNVSILPYIPSATIQFDGYGLKPNTRLYAYFGNVPVSGWCAPRLTNYSTGSVDGLQQTNALGTPLYSDTYGMCSGIFRIPPNTFNSQEIIFKLVDISDLSQGEDAITTEADATYYGSTLSVANGQSLLNTRQTVVSSTEVTQQQAAQGLAVATQVTQSFIPDPPAPYYGGSDCNCGGCFITTATVDYIGEQDDGPTLTTLRWFRDNIMMKNEPWKKDIEEYYEIAPSIVDKINNSANKEKIYKEIYNELLKAVGQINDKMYEEAYMTYKNMVHKYKEM